MTPITLTIRTAIAGLLLCATAAPAPAQDNPQQTPENAKTFLTSVLPGAKFLRNNVLNSSDRAVDLRDANGGEDYVGAITAAKENNPCSLRIDYRIPSFRFDGQNYDASTAWIFWDFKVVREIRNEGAKVLIFSTSSGSVARPDVIYATGPDLAVRIAYAMNFLKSRCNVADQTGF